MGKNRKRKRQKLSTRPEIEHAVTTSNNDDDEELSDDADFAIDNDSLAITVATLEQIARDPQQLGDKRFRGLRKALHPLVLRQVKSYQTGTDYRIKVTQYLAAHQWSDALNALQGCRDFEQIPKQGTIQRWVREVDGCHAACKLQLLNAILMVNQTSNATAEEADDTSSNLNRHDPRLAILEEYQTTKNQAALNTSPNGAGLQLMGDWAPIEPVMDPSQNWNVLPTIKLTSRILYQEVAKDRTPPNHYDLLLHTTEPGSIEFSSDPPEIQRHDLPFLKRQAGDAFFLTNVLTVQECQQLRAVATQLGYRPDHPTTLESPTGIDSCELLVDDSILQVISNRVRPYLNDWNTSTVSTPNATFHSINPRWRFFRYGQGCVYRPHIDGSWPGSRINANGEYECYSRDPDDGSTIKSFHTFLIYLNDDFEGGPTRFYVPHVTSGGLAAHGVSPRCGSVLVFSQGNTASLLHEGSAVTAGQKYVVRTDVLYKIRPFEKEEAKEDASSS